MSQPKTNFNITGKSILIIGGTAGIGKALAKASISQGASVTIVGRRNPDQELSSAKFIQKDLSLMKNAQDLTKELDLSSFHVIVFTNGIIAGKNRVETEEGVEVDMAVSYLSRFAICEEMLKEDGIGTNGKKPRIVVYGAPGKDLKVDLDDFNCEKNYGIIKAHLATVVANEALVYYLDEKFGGKVEVFGVDPGLVQSEIRDNFWGKGSFWNWVGEGFLSWFMYTADQYVEKIGLNIVLSEEFEGKRRLIFGANGKIIPSNPWLLKDGNQKKIIEESQKMLYKALAKK